MAAAFEEDEVPAPDAGADSRGTVTEEDGLYMVSYPHIGTKTEFLLGLFECEEETKRVRDVLTIKETVDEGRDLTSLRLFFPLKRYGVDPDTVREIRAVTFRQVVRDLQVCAIKPLRSPDDQQPTSWVGGAQSRPTNGTTANTLQAAKAGAAQAPLGGFQAQQQQQQQQQVSAVAAQRVRPMQPPPRFDNQPSMRPLPPVPSLLRQGEQQAQQAQQAQQQASSSLSEDFARQNGRVPAALGGRLPTGLQRGGRKRQIVDDSETSGGDTASMRRLLDAVEDAARGRAMPSASDYSLRSGSVSLPASADGAAAAGGRGGRPVKQRRATASASAEYQPGVRPWQGQDVLRFSAAQHPFHGITGVNGQMAAQIIVRFNGSVPHAQGATKRTIRLTLCSCAALAAVTWDLAAIWRALRYGKDPAELDAAPEASQALNFSFERYAPHLPALRAARTEADIKELVRELRDEPGRLESLATGRPLGPANGAHGSPTSEGGAAAASGSAGEAGSKGAADAAAAAADGERDDAELDAAEPMDAKPAPAAAPAPAAPVPEAPAPAAGGQDAAAAASAASPAAAPATAAAAAEKPGSPAGSAAAAGAAAAAAAAGAAPAAQEGGGGRKGRRRAAKVEAPRGSSGYKGVHGQGPWFAQMSVSSKRILPDRLQGWSSSREEQSVRVGCCSTPALGATCADLLVLWRAQQYGNDLESVALKFPLALYQPFLSDLDGARLSGIQAHITELRDGGSLQAVADAGQQAQQAAGQGKQAQQAAGQGKQAQQATGQGKKAQQAGSGAAAAAAARTTASPEQPATAERQAAYDPAAAAQRASVPAPASSERQQEQRSRGAPPAAAPAAAAVAAAAMAETSAAAAARGAPAAAAAVPPAPNAEVLAAAQGVLQQLRTLTAAELQQAAYRRDELPQVQVAQAIYAEVQAALAAVPRLSELDVVAYMAHFTRLRDMRSQLYREIVGWSAAGRHDLLVQHVRHMLPPRLPGQDE